MALLAGLDVQAKGALWFNEVLNAEQLVFLISTMYVQRQLP